MKIFKAATKLIAITICVIAIVITGCSWFDILPDSEKGAISGCVVASLNGAPIADAVVTTVPATDRRKTDGQGHFTYNNVTPGSYWVGASKEGYLSISVHVTVEAGKTATANIVLLPND